MKEKKRERKTEWVREKDELLYNVTINEKKELYQYWDSCSSRKTGGSVVENVWENISWEI